MSHIYLCYSRPNKSYADTVVEDLRQRGFTVWMDDRQDLSPNHLVTIAQAIQECGAFILIYSRIAEESNLVQRETDFALQNEKPFFTLFLEGKSNGQNAFDVRNGNLPPETFYISLKKYALSQDPAEADMLFDAEEDLFADLDLDEVAPVVSENAKLSFDQVDMDKLLSKPAQSNRKGQRKRARLLMRLVGFTLVVLIVAVIGAVLTLHKDEETDDSEDENIVFWQRTIDTNSDWESYIQEFDGVPMVLVPAGCFTMGSTPTEIEDAAEACLADDNCQLGQNLGPDVFQNEAPAHEICFEQPFWLDQYEVSNTQIIARGYPARPNDNPTDIFTWITATAYCKDRSARLPTEAEWEYAASGPNNFTFAWGNEFDASKVNSGDSLQPSGSISTTSWVGAYDMNGNVWEWTNTIYLLYPYVANSTHEKADNITSSRVLRGGAIGRTMPELRNSVRLSSIIDERGANFGVRCARNFSEADIVVEETPVPTE